ncbi:MAG: hypothetical protein U0531_21055 [Dehalococcoidia bacterium]
MTERKAQEMALRESCANSWIAIPPLPDTIERRIVYVNDRVADLLATPRTRCRRSARTLRNADASEDLAHIDRLRTPLRHRA